MPYIQLKERIALDKDIYEIVGGLEQLGFSKGALNYTITKLVHAYIAHHDKKYDTLSDITGVLNDVKTEFERRVVAPYEDAKIKENGDI